MKKPLSPVAKFLPALLRELGTDEAQSSWRNYQHLLFSCLPGEWHSRVLLGEIEGLRWQLWVANGSDGYRLRFLLSEIEAMLAKKLPHPPKLSVVVRADIWAQLRVLPQGGRLYPRHYYTESEADAVIDAFVEAQLRR
jgi:hypothetical protein